MNFPAPETRLSLLVRIGDLADQAAWEEFVNLYEPVIYRTARLRGLQDADARDVTQQVLVSVGQTLNRRPHDPRIARFRTWLATVIRNAVIDLLRRKRADHGSGDSAAQWHLEQVEASHYDAELLEREYQKELFRCAARTIQGEFSPSTWQAFWLSTVEGRSIEQVASELNQRVGSVYAARSRVIRRLRQETTRLQSLESGE